MPITFTNIAMEEPSTVTARVSAVTIARGSTNEQQEILVVGDPQSSLGMARVTDTTPDSTMFGIVVREAVAQSTTVNVSSLAGAVTIRSSAANALVSVYQSTAADLNVTVAGYSTTANISSVAGAVIVRSSAANALVSVYQSTASDLLTEPRLSTANSNSSAYLPVRLTDGSVFVTPGVEYTDGSTVSTFVGAAVAFQNGSNATMRIAGSTTPFPVHIRTDSGASVMDSTESAIKVNVVAGAAGGSTLVTVRQSTYTDFNALSRLADRDQSTQVAAVLGAAPVSTTYGLVVREAAHSTGPFAVSSIAGAVTVRSSAANLLASVYQSTAADLNVTVAGYSTTVNVSSLAGAVIVRSTANSLLASVYQSTAADLLTTARVNTSSGGAVEGSTASPAHGTIGLHVRQVPSSMATFAASTVGATSTNTVLVSSVAGARVKVYAFTVTSTVITNSTVSFRSSLAGVSWPLVIGSGSSGVTGANLAVPPPAFLFATDVGTALTFHTPSSGPEYSLAVSYFQEP